MGRVENLDTKHKNQYIFCRKPTVKSPKQWPMNGIRIMNYRIHDAPKCMVHSVAPLPMPGLRGNCLASPPQVISNWRMYRLSCAHDVIISDHVISPLHHHFWWITIFLGMSSYAGSRSAKELSRLATRSSRLLAPSMTPQLQHLWPLESPKYGQRCFRYYNRSYHFRILKISHWI